MIRIANKSDGMAIGRVHVESWQSTYSHIVPQSYLDALDPEVRGANWRDAIEGNPSPTGFRRLAAEVSGVVVGFALVAPARATEAEPDPPPEMGEVVLIYTVEAVWGTGVGSKLMAKCVESLLDLGFVEAILWVATENARARRFYEREGWQLTGLTRVEELDGNRIPESQYQIVLGR